MIKSNNVSLFLILLIILIFTIDYVFKITNTTNKENFYI